MLAACSGVGVRLFSVEYTSNALIPPTLAAVSKPTNLIISLVVAFFPAVGVTTPASANLRIEPPEDLESLSSLGSILPALRPKTASSISLCPLKSLTLVAISVGVFAVTRAGSIDNSARVDEYLPALPFPFWAFS